MVLKGLTTPVSQNLNQNYISIVLSLTYQISHYLILFVISKITDFL